MIKSTKKLTVVICLICILTAAFCSGFAAADADTDYDTVPVYVNGVRAADGYELDGATYVPLRAFVTAVSRTATLAWDQDTQTASVTDDGLYFSAQLGARYVTANGRCLFVSNGVKNIGGSTYVTVDSLAAAYGAEVLCDEEAGFVNVDVGNDPPLPIESGDSYYNAEDLYWLSHLIYSESGNQPLEGMIAVGNVVLNRTENTLFPDSIYGVVSQKGQFDVFTAGTIYAEPNALSVVAAKLCLEGVTMVDDALFFVNPASGGDTWFRANLTYIASIQDHDFYA
jgi:N-acetylmuramoyl-L-alanine amidase